jgi:hypothetical protein
MLTHSKAFNKQYTYIKKWIVPKIVALDHQYESHQLAQHLGESLAMGLQAMDLCSQEIVLHSF